MPPRRFCQTRWPFAASAPGPARHFPALLAGAIVERQQVRIGLVITEQDQQVPIYRGRAAVAPVIDERAVLLAQVALPKLAPFQIERHHLPIAEPGVDA